MENFVDENTSDETDFNVIRLIGGESAAEQALALAWCRHHIIVGNYLFSCFICGIWAFLQCLVLCFIFLLSFNHTFWGERSLRNMSVFSLLGRK